MVMKLESVSHSRLTMMQTVRLLLPLPLRAIATTFDVSTSLPGEFFVNDDSDLEEDRKNDCGSDQVNGINQDFQDAVQMANLTRDALLEQNRPANVTSLFNEIS
jgi:hypothetical protein